MRLTGGGLFSPFGSLWLALIQGSFDLWARGQPTDPAANTCNKQIWEAYLCWATLWFNGQVGGK